MKILDFAAADLDSSLHFCGMLNQPQLSNSLLITLTSMESMGDFCLHAILDSSEPIYLAKDKSLS
jgi:hypothetical protein